MALAVNQCSTYGQGHPLSNRHDLFTEMHLGPLSVFPAQAGYYYMLKRRYLYGLVQGYLKSAGIDTGKRGPHILRYTFCTRLHQKGVDPFTIKDLEGHKSLNTTMRYIRIENKEQAEAVDRLEFKIF